jgi:hypothetical protein
VHGHRTLSAVTLGRAFGIARYGHSVATTVHATLATVAAATVVEILRLRVRPKPEFDLAAAKRGEPTAR